MQDKKWLVWFEVHTTSHQQMGSWMPVFKEAVFPVAYGYSNIDKGVPIWTACLRHGSDLSADFLGKMALGRGWALGRVESLWLQCVWVILWMREQCSYSLLVCSQDWKEMMILIISVSTLSLFQHLPAHRMLSGSSRWSSKWPQAFPEWNCLGYPWGT